MAQFVGREREADGARTGARILAMMRAGKSDRRIARRLGIPPDQVRAYVDELIDGAELDTAGRADALAGTLGLADES